jgi:hypothetical protein
MHSNEVNKTAKIAWQRIKHVYSNSEKSSVRSHYLTVPLCKYVRVDALK